MSTLDTLLPMFAGKAWRSANELVSNPDLLHAAQDHVRYGSIEASMGKGPLPAALNRGWER